MINPIFNNYIQRTSDYLYDLEASFFFKLMVPMVRYVLSELDLAYARAGYLFSGDQRIKVSSKNVYGSSSFRELCEEVMSWYD